MSATALRPTSAAASAPLRPSRHVYCEVPWLMEEAPGEIDTLFEGAPVRELKAGEFFQFAHVTEVFWVVHGLVATTVELTDGATLLTGLFGRRSCLGAMRTFTHPCESMRLSARAVFPTRLIGIDAVRFRAAILANPSRARDFYARMLLWHEAQMEGILVLRDSLEVRLGHLVDVFYRAAGAGLTDAMAPLPVPVPVSLMAELLGATRSAVSRQISKWCEEGRAERLAGGQGRFAFSRAVLAAAR